MRNMLVGADMTVAEVDQAIADIQKETHVPFATLETAASGIFSARGKFTLREALDQLKVIGRTDPSYQPAELQSIAGASLDLRKAFGGTAEEAVGFTLAASSAARVETIPEFSQNAVPAIMGAAEYKDSAREAAALFAAFSQQSADVTGARSGTAMIQFSKQILEATANIKELEGKGTFERREWLLSGDPQAERIRSGLVGNLDPQNRAAGMAKEASLTMEAKQFMAGIGLLTPGSNADKAIRQAFQDLPEFAEGDVPYAKHLEDLGKSPLLKTAEVAEKGAAFIERQDIAETERTRIARAIKDAETTMLRAGVSNFDLGSAASALGIGGGAARFRASTTGFLSPDDSMQKLVTAAQMTQREVWQKEREIESKGKPNAEDKLELADLKELNANLRALIGEIAEERKNAKDRPMQEIPIRIRDDGKGAMIPPPHPARALSGGRTGPTPQF